MNSIGNGGLCSVVWCLSLLFFMWFGMIMLVNSRLIGVLLLSMCSVVLLLDVVMIL